MVELLACIGLTSIKITTCFYLHKNIDLLSRYTAVHRSRLIQLDSFSILVISFGCSLRPHLSFFHPVFSMSDAKSKSMTFTMLNSLSFVMSNAMLNVMVYLLKQFAVNMKEFDFFATLLSTFSSYIFT